MLATLAMLALVAAACGDSGGTTTAAAGDGGPTQTTAADGNGGDDGTDGTVTLGTLVDNLPGLDEDCLAVANAFGAMAQVSLALSGQSDLDEDEVRAQFDQARSALPGDLQDDVDVLAEAMINYFQVLQDLDIDFSDPQAVGSLTPEQFETINQAAAVFDSDDVTAASDNLSAYAEAQCPLDE